jgi:uncharacterized Zn finger protein (UPF0148 family)
MAASDALVGEGLSISPWKEALAERDALAVRLAELTGKRCVCQVPSWYHATGYTFCPYCGGRIELEGEK